MHKRSFTRGFAAGVGVKVLCSVVFTVVLAGIVHAGDPALEASLVREGRFPAFSGAWLTGQILVLTGAVLAGAASSHWSERGSWAAPLALALLWLVWSAAKVDAGQPVSVVVFRVSVSSIGILLGALVYQRWGRESDA
jgi:hypothetical protein